MAPRSRTRALTLFAERFGAPAALVAHAPGRVNLIGDHTDYNGGFVLPMAIDRATWIALRARPDRRVVCYSEGFQQTLEFDLDHLERGRGWGEYVKGVAWALEESGRRLQGWEGAVAGDVPIGAGLSSSASLELAAAAAFIQVADLRWDPVEMARLAQRAENEWVGMNCGIMDQITAAAGRAGHALLIDCRSTETSPVPLPSGVVAMVMDTATRRDLVDSAYNQRRAQCEAGARFFGVPMLRDLTEERLVAEGGGLDEVVLRRCRHVVTENGRTTAAARAMAAGDPAEVGMLMDQSHRSLRDDFAVSTPELDTMVTTARRIDGCHGARLTGAGFGGSAVALVDAGRAEEFAAAVAAGYEAAVGRRAHIYRCAAASGAAARPAGGT